MVAFHSAWNFAEDPLFRTPVSGIVVTNVILGSQSMVAHPLLNGGNFGIEAPLPSFTYPHIFGLDAAGTVVVVGDRVSGHNDLHQNGTLAEYAIFPTYQVLFCKLNLTGKKTILIHAGAGGVGSIALQLAKLKHLEVLTDCFDC